MSSQKARVQLTRRELLIGATALAGSFTSQNAFAGEPLAVIVHPSNKESFSVSELAAMFTTRKQSWSGGKRILPFNFPPKHEFRVEFDKVVLQMDPDDVARYWIDRRIRGGNAPPKQVPSAQLIVRLVQKLDGAVAYVPRSMATDVRTVIEL